MLLSAQMWTRESMLPRGRIAAPPLDRGSAPPDYSAYGSPMCARVGVSQASRSMTKLRDSLLPFAEPACSPRGLRGSEPQFPSQQNQIVCDIDVIEGLREAG